MSESLLLQTLARIEAKLDTLATEVAEIRGARKLTVVLASLAAAVIGGIAATWRK